jgi:hypothetical protein
LILFLQKRNDPPRALESNKSKHRHQHQHHRRLLSLSSARFDRVSADRQPGPAGAKHC